MDKKIKHALVVGTVVAVGTAYLGNLVPALWTLGKITVGAILTASVLAGAATYLEERFYP